MTADQILRVARLDAEKVYDDLSRFRINLALASDAWHVDFELVDPQMNGGGPHYIVDAASGEIVSKCYEQ
jgi:hypothetical protein